MNEYNYILSVDSTEYLGNFLFDIGLFKQYHFDGGYFTTTGSEASYKYYVNDHLGNVLVVSDANGTVEEVNHYNPYGALMGESQNTTTQPYKYNGKELDRSFGLDWYDYGARWLDGVGGRWSSMDPLCEKYYSVSSYVYCSGNPVMIVDPDGRHLEVSRYKNKFGVYEVVGGEADDDLNIYLDYGTENQTIIGRALTEYSFMYDNGKAVKGAIIDLYDVSGQLFLDKFMKKSPFIISYMLNAQGGEIYDFKEIGNIETTDEEITIYHNRGMSVNINGKKYLASARDVGNFVAGYMAGKSGLSWDIARLGFDALETKQNLSLKNLRFMHEELPTTKAQWKGFEIGHETPEGRTMREVIKNYFLNSRRYPW